MRRSPNPADSNRFKAVDTRDGNYTPRAIRLCLAKVEASIERYRNKLDNTDRQEAEVAEMRTTRLNEGIGRSAGKCGRYNPCSRCGCHEECSKTDARSL